MITYLNGAITAVQRDGDWKTYLTDDSRMWGCGRTTYEALGCLMATWPERFSVLPSPNAGAPNPRPYINWADQSTHEPS